MAVTPAVTVATLRRQAEERRARDARRAEEVRSVLVEIIRARLPPGSRAWLMGTLAWGGFGVRSDVDLVFDTTPDAAIAEIEIELT